MRQQTLEMRTKLDTSENAELLDIIFSAVLIGGISADESVDPAIMELTRNKIKVYKQAKSHFKAIFQDNLFFSEYDVFYQILVKYPNSLFTAQELERVLDLNRVAISSSKYLYSFITAKQAIPEGRQITNDEFFDLIAKPLMVNKYKELSHRYVEYEEYLTACDRYIEVFKRLYMLETAETMTQVLQGDDGAKVMFKGNSKTLLTSEDSIEYYNDRIGVINNMSAERGIQSLLFNEDYLLEQSKAQKAEALLDFGIIELDSVKNKMRRGNMVNIMGPPKGGKTTFTGYLVARALQMGYNVAVWPLEGTYLEWVALITSAMLSNRVDGEPSVEINRSNILYENYDSDDEKRSVSAMQSMLASGEKTGHLSFFTGVAYVEDFEEEMTRHYENTNRFDVIVMDSPINMQTKSKMSKSEYLSKGFMNLKSYVANKMKVPALCLVTAQYKQDVIDVMRRNPEAEIDVTSGGETAESIRTPDDVIGLFSTANERENNMMKVYDIASRGNGHFEPTYIGCKLGCAQFYSNPELNE